MNAAKKIVGEPVEIDIRVPIFDDLKKALAEKSKNLTASIMLKMPVVDKNLNQGALLVDLFELYIHDCQNMIQGPLGRYVADEKTKGFLC